MCQKLYLLYNLLSRLESSYLKVCSKFKILYLGICQWTEWCVWQNVKNMKIKCLIHGLSCICGVFVCFHSVETSQTKYPNKIYWQTDCFRVVMELARRSLLKLLEISYHSSILQSGMDGMDFFSRGQLYDSFIFTLKYKNNYTGLSVRSWLKLC